MLPITEQRLSIPYFILFENYTWYYSILISIVGNITIGIIIYLMIAPIMIYLLKVKYLGYLISLILENTRRRFSKIKNNSKTLGLICFIGLPLPFTGVWTGVLGAYLMKLPNYKVIISIVLGVIISAIIVGSLTILGNEIWISFIENSINKQLGFE